MSSEQPIPVLDDLSRIQAIDSRNMLRLINELPEQCETAMGIGRNFKPDEAEESPDLVYMSGVGDAGTAVEMAVAAVSEFVSVPVIADRGGFLPKSVSEKSVAIIVDYNGNSQSALRTYKEAKARGTRVICVTSGGKLREAAAADGVTIMRIPPGQPARTAIGYLFIPIVTVVEQLGLSEGLIEKLSYGIRLMKNVRETLRFDIRTERNVAKQIALAIQGKYVLVFGAEDYRSAVTCRWKSQLAANSKVPAFAGYFPDMIQEEISGWETISGDSSRVAMVFLRDSQDRTEVPELMNAAAGVLDGFDIVDAEMKGSTAIEKMLYGIYLADYVSYYLAIASEVNPTPTEMVKRLEEWIIEKNRPVEAQEASEAGQPE